MPPLQPAFNALNRPAEGALTEAVCKRDTAAVQSLLAQGADPDEVKNTESGDGDTLLMHAARHGLYDNRCHDIAGLLIAAFADVNKPNLFGITPLMCAASVGDIEMVRLLLEHHADPDQRDTWHRTALYLAQRQGHPETARIIKTAMEQPRQPKREVPVENLIGDPLFNGETLAEAFAPEKWVGKLGDMKKHWAEVPADLKKTFDFATALTTAQQDTLQATKSKVKILRDRRP